MYPHSLLPESWPVEVHLYGVMIAIGVLFAFGILFYYSKKKSRREKAKADGNYTVVEYKIGKILFNALFL